MSSPRAGFNERPVEAGIDAAGGQQLQMRAALDDAARVEHQYLVGVTDGAQAVRHDKAGAAGQQFVFWHPSTKAPLEWFHHLIA